MAANTQPIYTGEVFSWKTKLRDQVVGREVDTSFPVLLGNTGTYGALIYNIRLQHLGNDVGSVCRFWIRESDGTDYYLIGEMAWTEVTGVSDANAAGHIDADVEGMLYTCPIFDGVKAIHLQKNMNLYCALGTPLTSGINVLVFGGLYNQDV